MNRERATNLIGKRVITSDEVELGDVLDLELDLDSWRVSWIYLRLHRDLTDRFHVDAPLVMGSKALALTPIHVHSVAQDVRLRSTLSEVVHQAVVAFDTDATDHLGSE